MTTPAIFRPCLTRWSALNGSPAFLLAQATPAKTAGFSTTAPLCKRKRKTNKDNNKNRGVSSIYRSGPREPLSMSAVPLPKPRDFKPKINVDEKHGLWDFFPGPGKLMWTPTEMEEHGRAWTVEELRKKSWDDLHALWWVCCKERNRLATANAELERGKMGFGNRELQVRDAAVKKTMRSIKHALTERFYVWEDAVNIARDDPEINMNGEGEAYTPGTYEDEYIDSAGQADQQASTVGEIGRASCRERVSR